MTYRSLKFRLFFAGVGFFLVGLVYLLWSYILVDGNLVLSRFSLYWNFQQWLWQNLLPNHQLVTIAYGVLVVLMFLTWVLFMLVVKQISLKREKQLKAWQIILVYFLVTLPFLLSYNALSYDIFNYIFNAKMVVVYQANPHVKVALDFAFDPWTRFMHNVHTPAPYGYGWTGLSLLPYLVGLGKFTLTWLIFKFFSFLSLVLVFFSLRWVSRLMDLKVRLWQWAAFFLNPLIVIEILGNGHNDMWMMSLFLLAVSLVLSLIKGKKLKFWRWQLGRFSRLTLSLFLFLLSAWIKLATLASAPWYGLLFLVAWFDWERPKGLLGGLMAVWLKERVRRLVKLTPLVLSGVFFLLLLTARSKQFLPWYLSWSLVFLPLLLAQAQRLTFGVVRLDKHSLEWLPRTALFWSFWLVAFSFSSLMRYLPWLLTLEYSQAVLRQQLLVTWLGGSAVFMLLYLLRKKLIFYLIDS